MICINDFKEGEEVRVIRTCRHIYHETCIEGWIKKEEFCPLCKEDLDFSAIRAFELKSQVMCINNGTKEEVVIYRDGKAIQKKKKIKGVRSHIVNRQPKKKLSNLKKDSEPLSENAEAEPPAPAHVIRPRTISDVMIPMRVDRSSSSLKNCLENELSSDDREMSDQKSQSSISRKSQFQEIDESIVELNCSMNSEMSEIID